ncbi:SusC/RagA family TonB-linked outer membrane protein [Pedobacter chinensis]|uniref:SusC/RagA family TonB-linked outer membrane protein n=1 Tax=Pedobacter chinensis TaxID=2282421 RepID=A0A369PZS5_9SPHI|nr:SusC/RagA family TonB-linked outer membrane protein [Pedobacter chinensis]RDC58191.1 SusC/RagA family TonB-linked outer membrane protein [Pedobacter chinensis]
MIKKITLNILNKGWIKLTGIFILPFIPYLLFAQGAVQSNQDTVTHNSSRVFSSQIVDNWNRTATKKYQIAGTSTIYGKDLGTTPVADISNVMAGRLPGLYTIQSSGATGYDNANIGLRGQNPIVVVDGVVRSFTSFNPNDIKTITVMKDALSTAMFGLRSSKGVIYITTKDRAENKPFEISFGAQYGLLNNLKTPNFITGAAYANLYNEAQQNTNPGSTPLYNAATINAYQNGTNDPFLQPNTNWYDLVYKKNSAQQRYHLDVAGNSKTYRYYVSLENFNQDGNFITDPANAYNTNNFYKRYSIRTNAQMDFNDDITVILNVFGSIENNNGPGSIATPLPNLGVSSIMSSIFATSPLAYAPRNPDGTFGGTAQITNNILANTISTGYIPVDTRTLSADVSLNYKLDDITKGLWAKGMLSINNYYQQYASRTKTFAIYYPTTIAGVTSYTKSGTDGNLEAGKAAYLYNGQLKQTYINFLLGYDKQIGDHEINLLATYNNDNSLINYVQLNQVYKNAGLTASYNYNKTYLAEISGVFGSYNRYAPENRWNFLPSLGLGWLISNESWFKSSAISFLKLRGTIGQTAWADPDSYYAYIQRFTTGAAGYVFGTSLAGVAGASESGVATNLASEKAWKYDLGAEVAFLDNKLNLGINYYKNRYYDLIRTPGNGYNTGIFGQSYPSENIGKTRFSGFETTINFANEKASSFNYSLGLNVSVEKSKILSYDEQNLPYSWLYSAGTPVTAGRGYEAIGFYQAGENAGNTATLQGYTPTPGDIKYKDLNGDGTINFLDVKQIGTNKPRVFFGLNFNLNYENFDLSGLFQGIVNREVQLNAAAMSAFNNSTGYVLDYTTENRWTPQNSTSATLPRLTLGSNTNNTQVSNFWLRKANYLRLKNLEIGYSIPSKLINKAKISKLRFFVNAYNLFTVSQLEYLDPESLTSGFTNNRIINGGVTLKL